LFITALQKIEMKLLSTMMILGTTMRTAAAFMPASVARHTSASTTRLHLLGRLFGTGVSSEYPVYADESVMSKKAHGTSEKPVQTKLRWNCDFETADRICNFNRHYAEHSGYWQTTDFVKAAQAVPESEWPIKFYDSVTGKLLFMAPVGRSMDNFLKESQKHGWPSFRDEETNWENVRCLKDGESISVSGTHLGHNIPDATGNRYCINLVSVAGEPVE
jgi:hypothetical protein